jgi:hypothetical protein
MTAKKYFWKIWLRLNTLTKKADNDYIAEVSTTGNTLRNEDIARHIVKERSEYRYESILSIFHERDKMVREAILNGSSVQDGNVHLTPRVIGNFLGSDPVYNPKEHKITCDATLTADFRKALNEEVGVELLGKKVDGGAVIGLVTDVATGKTDGTITHMGDVIITGEKIKVAPDKDDTLGAFLVDSDGNEVRFDTPFAINGPKRIVCRTPDVPKGTYTLKIVTQYAGSDLLKQPRTIVYELPVNVVS